MGNESIEVRLARIETLLASVDAHLKQLNGKVIENQKSISTIQMQHAAEGGVRVFLAKVGPHIFRAFISLLMFILGILGLKHFEII